MPNRYEMPLPVLASTSSPWTALRAAVVPANTQRRSRAVSAATFRVTSPFAMQLVERTPRS